MNRHHAPPVVYPLRRSPFLAGALLALWLAGFIAVLLWCYTLRQLDWRMAMAGFFVLIAGLAARRSWANQPEGRLAWDGASWRWESPGYQTGAGEHELSVIADFQRRMLLRLENQAGARLWLCVERTAMPERWLDLRRAVYSPHKPVAAATVGPFDLPPPAVSPSDAMPSQHVPHAKP